MITIHEQARQRGTVTGLEGRLDVTSRIDVLRRDIPPEVEWRCRVCEDAGVISGWRGTHWDLSGGPSEPTGDPEDERVVKIDVSHEEHELLRDRVELFDPDPERIVAGARPAKVDRVVMSGRLDDWVFLLGEIAFEANHTDDRPLQRRLEALTDRMDSAIR